MSWQWWCASLGLILVAAGAALAFIGFRKTWSDFVVNEKFWRALTIWLPRWWGKAWKAFVAAYQRLIRHKSFVTDSDHATAVDASAPIGWNVLPAEFPEGKELPEIVRGLWERQSDLERQLGDNIRQANQSFGVAQEDLGKRVALVDEKVVKVAVGGLSLQAWGLILVIGGTALSSVPALAQVSSPQALAPAHASPSNRPAAHAVVQASGSIWATDVPGWITAVGTSLLAVFAILTAIYAIRAFRKQSQEVRAIEQQVKDQQELTRQQGELLKVQSGQLELQRHQLDDQRQANARQAEVFELQATELRESLAERKREAELQRSGQATRVFISETHHRPGERPELRQPTTNAPIRQPAVRAYVKNSSEQPIYDAELRWHRGSAGYGEPNPERLGTLMPGQEAVAVREFPDGTNLVVSGAVLTFRDAAGVIWMRRPDGGLTEQQ